jgi:hypothetical protein
MSIDGLRAVEALAEAPSNKRMQLTRRGDLGGAAASRPIIIESRLAADPRCLHRREPPGHTTE